MLSCAFFWEREFAGKAPRALGRDILALGIAYARQERSYGGLARPVAKELNRLLARVLRDEAADVPSVRTSPLPRTGTMLVRDLLAPFRLSVVSMLANLVIEASRFEATLPP